MELIGKPFTLDALATKLRMVLESPLSLNARLVDVVFWDRDLLPLRARSDRRFHHLSSTGGKVGNASFRAGASHLGGGRMAQRDLFRSAPAPWNVGRIIGAKPPFKPKHIWAIREHLEM